MSRLGRGRARTLRAARPEDWMSRLGRGPGRANVTPSAAKAQRVTLARPYIVFAGLPLSRLTFWQGSSALVEGRASSRARASAFRC
jgi:hypothetical protein